MKKLLAALALCVCLGVRANTDGNLMLSVFSPGQLPLPTTVIRGACLSLVYGECLDLHGASIGGGQMVRQRLDGLQINLYNDVGTDAFGCQIGCYSHVESDFFGCQLGLVNFVGAKATGCQIGIFNSAATLNGCQLGLWNVVHDRDRRGFPLLRVNW